MLSLHKGKIKSKIFPWHIQNWIIGCSSPPSFNIQVVLTKLAQESDSIAGPKCHMGSPSAPATGGFKGTLSLSGSRSMNICEVEDA